MIKNQQYLYQHYGRKTDMRYIIKKFESHVYAPVTREYHFNYVK